MIDVCSAYVNELQQSTIAMASRIGNKVYFYQYDAKWQLKHEQEMVYSI